MCKKRLTLVFAMAFSALVASAQNINWVGGTGDWDTPAGWSSGAVPTASQNTFLANGDNVTVSGTSAEANYVRVRNGTSSANLTIAAGGVLTTRGADGGGRAFWVADNGGSGASVVVDGTLNASSDRIMVGGFGNNQRSGSMTINPGAFVFSDGMVIQNNSTVTMTGGQLFVNRGLGADTLVVTTRNQNGGFGGANKGHLVINGGDVFTRAVAIQEDSVATVNGGSLSTTANLNVGALAQNQTAVFTQNAGQVLVGNNLDLAQGNNSADGQYDMNGGRLNIRFTLNVESGSFGSGGVGTFNLNGGRLELNNLNMNNTNPAENIFNWNGGVLSKNTIFDSFLQFTASTGATETGLQIGNNNAGDGLAILDLGVSYLDSGTQQTRFDSNGNGDLTLASDSYLSALGSMRLHRPGIGTTESGSIPLLQQFNSITGTFGGWSGASVPQYSGSTTGISGPADLPLESILLVYVDNNGNATFEGSFNGTVTGVNLWYNLQGAAPEPDTVAFIVFGALMLRLSRNRHFQRARKGKAA